MLSRAWRCSEGWMLSKSLPCSRKSQLSDVPGDAALVIHDLAVCRRGDEAAFGFLEILLVGEG